MIFTGNKADMARSLVLRKNSHSTKSPQSVIAPTPTLQVTDEPLNNKLESRDRGKETTRKTETYVDR
jgi:hypothetical protein